MRWSSLPMAGALGIFVALQAFAQPPADGAREGAALVPVAGVPAVGSGETEYFSSDAMTTDVPMEVEPVVENSRPDPVEGFLGYRYELSSTEWIVGNGEQFGAFSLNWDHYKPAGVQHGVGVGLQFHFLSGPIQTDMPARVYDFSLAYQHRDQLGAFSYDVSASVMASSDFEGNSREGIRFPGHAVGFWCVAPKTELVFGADYLDRGDIKLLPVGGLIMVPHEDVRLEVVFPRPRAVFRLTGCHQLYVCGELGGGTWAIERAGSMVDDLATYRDLRLCIGLQSVEEDGDCTAFEIGYLFDRRLEYTSGIGNFSPENTAMIRVVRTF